MTAWKCIRKRLSQHIYHLCVYALKCACVCMCRRGIISSTIERSLIYEYTNEGRLYHITFGMNGGNLYSHMFIDLYVNVFYVPWTLAIQVFQRLQQVDDNAILQETTHIQRLVNNYYNAMETTYIQRLIKNHFMTRRGQRSASS